MHLPKVLATRYQLEPTTWFLAGACLQFLFFLVLPRYVAFLPAAGLLAARVIGMSLRTAEPVTPSLNQNDVYKGRYTAQLPHEGGSEIVLFIVGASVNNSVNRYSDDNFKVLARFFLDMWKEAEKDREKWGYLGKSSPLEGITSETKSTVITLSYWKNLESLQAFAAGPGHQEGWAWWNRTAKQHPQLGIMHEVYAAPKGHWENIYVNFRPIGMGQIKIVAPGDDNLRSPLVAAKGPNSRTMLGRMSQRSLAEGFDTDEN